MGVKDLWTKALGIFKEKHHEPLSKSKGFRLAVDAGIFKNKCNNREVTQLATTNNPPFPSPEIVDWVKHVHPLFLDAGVHPVYVNDGPAPDVKALEKVRRAGKREKAGKEYRDILDSVVEEGISVISDDDLEKAIVSRKKMAHPTVLDDAALIMWFKESGIECVGALFEADQQLRKLEMDGLVDGIVTEDGDEIILGGVRIYSKLSTKDGQLSFRVFESGEFFDNLDRYHSKVAKYPQFLPEISLFLGNDYCERVSGNGIVTVLEDVDHAKHRKEEEKRHDNGLIDLFVAAPDKMKWLENYARSNASIPEDYARRHTMAARYIRHAPVLEKDKTTGKVKVVPLNPLPEGVTDWETYLGFDFFSMASVSEEDYEKLYSCDVVPLTGKPVSEHLGPVYPEVLCGKYGIPRNTPLPLFAELDFAVVPVCMQPMICLQAFLQAHGVCKRESDTRDIVERNVKTVLRVGREVIPPHIKTISGYYTGFEALGKRQSGNEYDTWNRDYLAVAKRICPITDDFINNKLEQFLPGIRTRGMLELMGGNVNPKSIQCLNVTSKIDESANTLIRCDCLSSERSVIHTVSAVFKDELGGDFQIAPLSTCSCEEGALFCSHMLAFLLMIGLVQDVSCQQDFESVWPERPELLQAIPTLIENIVLKDKFKRSLGQRKRQKKVEGGLSNKIAKVAKL